MQNFYDIFLNKFKNKLRKREIKKLVNSFEIWLENNPYHKITVMNCFKSDDEIINLIYKYYLYAYDPDGKFPRVDAIKKYIKFIEFLEIETFKYREKAFFKFNSKRNAEFIRSNLHIAIQHDIDKNDREAFACVIKPDFIKSINNFINLNVFKNKHIDNILSHIIRKLLKTYVSTFIKYEDFYSDLKKKSKRIGKENEHCSKSYTKSARELRLQYLGENI